MFNWCRKGAFFWAIALAVAGFGILPARACDPLDEQIELTPVPPQTSHGLHRYMKLDAALKAQVDLVLFGDSLVEQWPAEEAVRISPNFVNLGIAADKAYSASWRLTHGDWSIYNPKSVVFLLGTNDMNFVIQPCAISAGLEQVIGIMQKIWPRAHIYVIDILPRGRNFATFDDKRKEISGSLRNDLSKDSRVSFLNVDNDIDCGGAWPCRNYLPGAVHLSPEGYKILTDRIIQVLSRGR